MPEWFLEEELQKIMCLTKGRLVGGSVREMIQNKKPQDFDIATPLSPNELIKLFQETPFKVIPTGLKHGTVTIVGNMHYEVTTLRKDIQTFGRHAKVAYTDSWEEDAARRDFTMNALYCDSNGLIYDYNQGLKDLESNIIRFIGDPETRIKEDYLRILRYFRFLSRYQGPLDELSYSACCALSQNLETLSGERITKELWKILDGPFSLDAISKMTEGGLLAALFPEGYNVVYLDMLSFLVKEPSVRLKFFLLSFPKDQKSVTQLKNKFKLSNEISKYLHAMRTKMKSDLLHFDEEFYHFLFKHGAEVARDWIIKLRVMDLISCEFVGHYFDFIKDWKKRPCPIQSDDLRKMGYVNGPELGKMLEQVETQWIESGFTLSRKECLASVPKPAILKGA